MNLEDLEKKFYNSKTTLDYFREKHFEHVNDVGFDRFLANMITVSGMVKTIRFLRSVFDLSLMEARNVIRENAVLEECLEQHRYLRAARDIAEDILQYEFLCRQREAEENDHVPF